MITRLKQSIAINSLDANSHLLLARYYEILANSEAKIKPNHYTELAKQEYKNAIKHQPSWDYAWAKLASFYSNHLPQSKDNLTYALSKAILLGPYENNTQKLFIPLIFKYWDELHNSSLKRAQVKLILKNSLKYYRNHLLILNSALEFNKLDEIEPLIEHRWHKNILKKYKKSNKKP